MKNTIFGFVVAILTITAFTPTKAQHFFILPELQSLCLKDSSEFKTTVSKAGYSFAPAVSSTYLKVFLDKDQNKVAWGQNPYDSFMAIFETTAKPYYIYLKTISLTESNGWKYVGEEVEDLVGIPTTWYHYTNGKYHVAHYSLTPKINGPTWYSVFCYLEEE